MIQLHFASLFRLKPFAVTKQRLFLQNPLGTKEAQRREQERRQGERFLDVHVKLKKGSEKAPAQMILNLHFLITVPSGHYFAVKFVRGELSGGTEQPKTSTAGAAIAFRPSVNMVHCELRIVNIVIRKLPHARSR